jgi:hypothetical protein
MALAVVDYVRDAERILRDSSQFKWYTVTLLVLVMYVYAVEVERRRWDIVFAGLAFWLADWFNEVVNALVLHFSDRAPLWAVTGSTSYLILIGLCIEICFMFAIGGIVYAKVLPEDRACGSSACRTGSQLASASRSPPWLSSTLTSTPMASSVRSPT